MQLVFDVIISFGLYLCWFRLNKHYNKIYPASRDISNLYQSRDGLWKELTKLQQTSKRRHKDLLQRVHNLERRIKQYEFTGRQNEAQSKNQTQADGTYSEYSSQRTPNFGQV